MKKVLIIAGSDSSGGAGVQADIKTASAIGLYPLTVVTAITSQNTKGVHKIHLLPQEHVKSQIDAICDDIEFDAVKIGMLGSIDIAQVVIDFVKNTKKPVILDPVMFAQSGSRLTPEHVFNEMMKYSYLITPNYFEAQKLSNIKIECIKDAKEAAKKLCNYAPRVLIKGGDSKIDFDVFYDGHIFYEFKITRINTRNTHGTGCSLATAIASYLALYGDILEAIKMGRDFVLKAIIHGIPLGSQFGTVNQMATIYRDSLKYNYLMKLNDAFLILKELKIGRMLPEIQSNLVYSLPEPLGIEDVAGFKGRIVSAGDDIYTLSYPQFGGSKHIARLLLTAKSFFPELNSAMAIRYDKKVMDQIKKTEFKVTSFDRNKEPKEIRNKEGSSLDWGVREACKELKSPPDFIYDEGGMGKEPVIRVLGRDPFEIVEKIKRIKGFYKHA